MPSKRKHQKHSLLEKPKGGYYHSNEGTILGAPCGLIAQLISKLAQLLDKNGSTCGYLDMEHQAVEMATAWSGQLTDKINHFQYTSQRKLHRHDYKKLFADLDLLFVNGNHFSGQKQIAVVNEKKKDSLKRKLDKLTDLKVVILDEGISQPFGYLADFIQPDTLVISISETEKLAELLITSTRPAPLYGLVLAGGKSQRMGTNKVDITYHNQPQALHEADLLSPHCAKTHLSVSESGTREANNSYPSIPDTFTDLGPYGAILSAFRHNPNVAWLTLACDLPYLDGETIKQLVTKRNPSKLATCFYNPETDFPEPLITIWEPRAYPTLLDFLSQGQSCPRKVLINSDIEMIKMKESFRMKNANTPEERAEAEKFLAAKK